MAIDDPRAQLTLDPMESGELGVLTALMAATFDADAPLAVANFDPHLLDPYHCADFFVRLPPGCAEADQYTLHLGGEVAGAAVVWHFAPGAAVLGLFFVAPAHQHHGHGRGGWELIQAHYPEVGHWAVAAPRWSPATVRFYQRQCGFRPAGGGAAYLSLEKHSP